ncbi:MAG: PepSY domain-containing protein [Steroidobacteraceae bacterium]
MNKTFAALIAATVVTGSSVVLAQTTQPTAPAELTIQQVIDKLETAGYTAIGDVEKDDGHWEAEATNKAAQRVEVELDSSTGAVVREEPDNDKD